MPPSSTVSVYGVQPAPVTEEQAERVRTRVRLLVELTTRAGRFRRGLVAAARSLTPYEAAVLGDLEAHGLNVDQLRDVLCGGHVLVDDPALYDRWLFPQVSRQRLSSHHKQVDKGRYPDIGMRGPLVREKLHGRTATGTWLQLEKTPATFGGGQRVPSWNDVRHLVDYVTYRITRSNVGPWGLSGSTERRPMYLAPELSAEVALPAATARSVARAVARLEQEDDLEVSADLGGGGLAGRFAPPRRADPVAELLPHPERRGRGLFASSQVWVTETASAAPRRLLDAAAATARWDLPQAGTCHRVAVVVGGRRLVLAARGPAAAPDSWSPGPTS